MTTAEDRASTEFETTQNNKGSTKVEQRIISDRVPVSGVRPDLFLIGQNTAFSRLFMTLNPHFPWANIVLVFREGIL